MIKRNNKIKKGELLMAAVVAGAGFATGCGNKDNGGAAPESQTTAQADASGKTETAAPDTAFSYPVAEGGTLSYWVELNANAAANYTSLSDRDLERSCRKIQGSRSNSSIPQ